MTDQHVKGAVSSAKGTLNEDVGKLAGDTVLETKGKVQEVLGKTQDRVGDLQGRGRMQPIVMSVIGAVLVILVAGLLTGLVRMSPGRG